MKWLCVLGVALVSLQAHAELKFNVKVVRAPSGAEKQKKQYSPTPELPIESYSSPAFTKHEIETGDFKLSHRSWKPITFAGQIPKLADRLQKDLQDGKLESIIITASKNGHAVYELQFKSCGINAVEHPRARDSGFAQVRFSFKKILITKSEQRGQSFQDDWKE